MRKLIIASAAAALAVPFSAIVVASPASAAPCTPPVQGPQYAGQQTPCMVCMNAAGSNVNAQLACIGQGPVGSPHAQDPQCAQYQIPSDIQRCEDELHGAQHP
jgi:hypothetical protein